MHAAVQSDRESEQTRELQAFPDHFGARTTEELKKSYTARPVITVTQNIIGIQKEHQKGGPAGPAGSGGVQHRNKEKGSEKEELRWNSYLEREGGDS